jgi:putative transposase
MDFVADALFDGRKIRALTLVDNYSRRCLAIKVGQQLRGCDVVRALEDIRVNEGIIPKRIQADNGSEFIGKDVDRWAYEHGVIMDYSRPGKPTDNPFIESFNGSFRDECLNAHWFLSLPDASSKIEAWRIEYNSYRPHSSLEGLTPDQFVEKHLIQMQNAFLPEAPPSGLMSSSAKGNLSSGSSEDICPDGGLKTCNLNPDSPV